MEYALEGMGAGIIAFYIVYMLVIFGFSIASYVLRAAGFYSIAKRRGINHPWMSWVPVLDLWVLGCISDQFQYVVKGKTKNKRKWLLGLNIALAVVYIVFFVFFGVMMVDVVGGVLNDVSESQLMEGMLGTMIGMLICYIPMIILAIAVMVFRYMAMYDLYTSCSPQNNVLFLVLSIFFSVTEPFFIFFNRKKDGGMPPRRTQPQSYIPPQPQYEAPQYEPPQYEAPRYEAPQQEPVQSEQQESDETTENE